MACRITVDEIMYRDGIDRAEIEEVIGELGEIPDLWDFVPGTWEDDSVTSRFSAEAHEEQWVRGLKALTSRPGSTGGLVRGVGVLWGRVGSGFGLCWVGGAGGLCWEAPGPGCWAR